METKTSDPSDARHTGAERKKMLDQELARYVRLLTAHGNPERVILFGTLANGPVHAWSDIDLVVIERTVVSLLRVGKE